MNLYTIILSSRIYQFFCPGVFVVFGTGDGQIRLQSLCIHMLSPPLSLQSIWVEN